MTNRILALTVAVLALAVAHVHAQPLHESSAGDRVFVDGAFLVTSILNDKQDTHPGQRHYNFIGELDWPTTGGLVAAGVSVARHWSVGGELALRRAISTPVSEQMSARFDSWVLSSLYTSRERLLSAVVHYKTRPDGQLMLQPIGGVTFATTTQTLTGRRGVYTYPTIPPMPISESDLSVTSTKFGLVGGGDVAVRVSRRVAVLAAPRIHWIHRAVGNEYEHVVPYAGRVIAQIGVGVRCQMGSRR